MRTALRRTLSGSIAITAAVLVGGPAAASAPPAYTAVALPGEEPETFLLAAAHGARAVDRLAGDLPAVAAINQMTARGLVRLLEGDPTVWVHPTGRLYYADPAPTDVEPRAAEAAPYPYGDTFALHSRPGSSKTIYLDFDGEYVAGTLWNSGADSSLPAQSHPAFSLDSDPTTFTNAERDVIQNVWQRVSEDYAPFDVDVTTAAPGPSGLVKDHSGDPVFGTRALVTPSQAAASALCDNLCGGVAFIGTFGLGHDDHQPAWVLPHKLAWDPKSIAEAVSHEVGHNLGLDHDASTAQHYYDGHGSWAPIMGGSYDRPISQWSRGEYAGATNTEDDLTVITRNGLTYVPDEHGDSAGTATALPTTSSGASGLISTRGDRDYFALPSTCGGDVTVTASPAVTSPNLDLRLRLVAGNGTQLAVDDPASSSASFDAARGMGASATVTAAPGTPVYIEVDGVGAGNPATDGYSDYGSLGAYRVTVPPCIAAEPAVVTFDSATQTVDEGAGTAHLVVTRTGNTTVPSSADFARTGGTAIGDDLTATSGTVTFAAGETRSSISLPITDDTFDESDETVLLTLTSPGSGTTLGAIRDTTVTIIDNDEAAGGRPDLSIARSASGTYLGDGVHSTDGVGQSVKTSARRGQVRRFFVELHNDGPATDVISLVANHAGRGVRVTYVNEGRDVTRWITGGDGRLSVPAGQLLLVRVEVRIGRRAPIGSLASVVVTAASADGTRADLVAGTVAVRRR